MKRVMLLVLVLLSGSACAGELTDYQYIGRVDNIVVLKSDGKSISVKVGHQIPGTTTTILAATRFGAMTSAGFIALDASSEDNPGGLPTEYPSEVLTGIRIDDDFIDFGALDQGSIPGMKFSVGDCIKSKEDDEVRRVTGFRTYDEYAKIDYIFGDNLYSIDREYVEKKFDLVSCEGVPGELAEVFFQYRIGDCVKHYNKDVKDTDVHDSITRILGYQNSTDAKQAKYHYCVSGEKGRRFCSHYSLIEDYETKSHVVNCPADLEDLNRDN